MDLNRKLFDYYDVLGVGQGADEAEIKRAYRRRALRWHPDRNPEDPSASEMFKQISEAYAALGDPARRRQYDLSRGFARRQQVTPPGAEPLRDPRLNPRPEPMADPFRRWERPFTLLDLEIEEFLRRVFWGS